MDLNPDQKSEIQKSLSIILQETVGDSDLEISRDTRFDEEGLNLDSLDKVEMVMDIEEEYGIRFPDKQNDTYNSVGKVLDHIYDNIKPGYFK